MEHFYKVEKGWRAGPHFFIDEDQCWGLSHPSEPGVHAASFNGEYLGIEILGNYDIEDAETGRGLACWTMAASVSKVLLDWLEQPANEQTVLFHRDDPKTKKQCPGSSIRKSWVLNLIEPASLEWANGLNSDEPAGDTARGRLASHDDFGNLLEINNSH